MNSTRTTSGLDWNEMLGLVSRLKSDGHYRDCLLIACGSYLGLRASDLLNLKWKDVIDKDELLIAEKKTGKHRTISINQNLQKLLRELKAKATTVKPIREEDFLFSNRWGSKISVQYVNRRLHEIFRRYQVKAKNPSTHTLRKTFGKRVWEMDGKSERALIYLAQIFNHSSVQITRRYIGIVQEDIDNIYMNL